MLSESIHSFFTFYSPWHPQGKSKYPLQWANGNALTPHRTPQVQIKGTKSGLLLHLHERPLTTVVAKLRERLATLPQFYRGGRAVLMLGDQPLAPQDLDGILATLEEFGIAADGAVCDAQAVAEAARGAGLQIVAASVAAAPRVHDDRTEPADIRKAWHEGGESAARRALRHPSSNGAASSAEAQQGAQNCYYKGTLRSGQSLSAFGNIVVVGDINAGAELIATGDIMVWGTLRGVAHAGAEGDDAAAVYALRLEPTQLRISRHLAASPNERKKAGGASPEVARIIDGAIVIETAGSYPNRPQASTR